MKNEKLSIYVNTFKTQFSQCPFLSMIHSRKQDNKKHWSYGECLQILYDDNNKFYDDKTSRNSQNV